MTGPNPLIDPEVQSYGIGNNKGGVGKSSVTARVAEQLAARGRRVLVGDGDPQANLSRMMGWPEHELMQRPTINEVVLEARKGCAGEAIVPCGWDRLPEMPDEVMDLSSRIDLLPGRYDYELRVGEAAGHDPKSAMARHARERLAVALDGVVQQYDYFLLDFPPSIGPLAHMAMMAVEGLLIPLYPDYDPIGGAIRTRDLLAAAAADWNHPELHVFGYLINRYDPGRKKAQQDAFLPYIYDVFGRENVLSPVFHERTVYADVAGLGYPLRAEPGWRRRDRVKELDELCDQLEQGQVVAA